MQNLVDGPFGRGIPGGAVGWGRLDEFSAPTRPLPSSGAADDGDALADIPVWRVGRTFGGEVGEGVQKIYSYGIHRNSFGMAFDPKSGRLWQQENGDDSFSELNRVFPGMNLGWIQIMGPA